jgi:hypothetical protein
VSAVLLGPWIGFYLLNPFGFDNPIRDSWHHIAVLRELIGHPFEPTNPHIATAEGSRYYTPVNVLASLVGRALGLSPFAVFNGMGALTLVGLAGACWSFGQRYFKEPWAPLLLLLSLLFAWGVSTSHAGFHNYAVWLASAAYPSSISLVLGIFLWSASLKAVGQPNLFRLFSLALLTGTIFLTHQLSGAIMIAGAGSFIVFQVGSPIRNQLACVAAIGVGCLATLAWPYFSVIDVLASTGDNGWHSQVAKQNLLSTALMTAVVPLIGIAGFRKLTSEFRFELLAPAAVFLAVYVALQVMGNPIAHRLPPAFILFCQLGLVWLVLERWPALRSGSTTSILMLAGAGLFLVASLATSMSSRLDDLSSRGAQGWMVQVERVREMLPDDSISFATDDVVFPLQSTGRRVVSIPRPEPAAPSLAARQAATARFFDAHTDRAQRLRAAERWHATHVVFDPTVTNPTLAEQLRALGEHRTVSRNFEVITLDQRASGPESEIR